MTHGIVKVVLVTALLFNKLWAYPWMIMVLILFISYQLYRIVLQPTAGMVALTIFDFVILALTCREYGQQRRATKEEAIVAPAARPRTPSETRVLSLTTTWAMLVL